MASAVGFVSYLFTGFGLLTPDAPIIEISTGKLLGLAETSRDGRPFFEYLGIRYGKPPLGDLRFEPPVPAEKWKGIYKAKEYGNPCVQVDTLISGAMVGSEDCLYLNVFTPRIEGKLPVLVNFHGGGFTSGDSKQYGTKYWQDEDLVVVTMNFRLYALGFLNTGDELIRGNMGFKDQNLALRWVQENIRKFGGDPDKVTIMGSGTGGLSVHYHILSPLSKGLFSKAISQSANAACPWAFIRDPLSQAQRYGKQVNCPTRNTSALVRCLKKKKAKDLIQISNQLMYPIYPQEDFFTGTLETVKREDTFLQESPFDILELGNFNKVPWILGVNSGEGSFTAAKLLAYPEVQLQVGRRWKEYAPMLAHFDPNRTDISDKLRQYYFGNSQYLNPGFDVENFTQFISDGNFFHPTHYAAIRHARHAPTFLYYFTYKPRRFPNRCSSFRAMRHDDWIPAELKVTATIIKDISDKHFSKEPALEEHGICPDQQLPLFWNSNIMSEVWRNNPDYHFSKSLISTVAAFMENEEISRLKYNGLPWPPITVKGSPLTYMQLDHPPKIIEEPFAKYLPFWDSLNIRNGYDNRNL